MKAAIPIIISVVLMHITGCAVFFGTMTGIYGVLGAPILSLFAWFMVPFEAVGASFQWFLYSPKKGSVLHFISYAVLSAAVGGLCVMVYAPMFLGFLTGASAAIASFLCIHLFKASGFDDPCLEQSNSDGVGIKTETDQAASSNGDKPSN